MHRGRMQCVEGRGRRKGVWKLIRREATNDAYIAFLFEKKARGGFETDGGPVVINGLLRRGEDVVNGFPGVGLGGPAFPFDEVGGLAAIDTVVYDLFNFVGFGGAG